MNEKRDLYLKILFGIILCSLATILILMDKQYIITYVSGTIIFILGILIIVFGTARYSKCLCYKSLQNDTHINDDDIEIIEI